MVMPFVEPGFKLREWDSGCTLFKSWPIMTDKMGSLSGRISDDEDDWEYLQKQLQRKTITRERALEMWRSCHYIARSKPQALAVLKQIDPNEVDKFLAEEAAAEKRHRIDRALETLSELSSEDLNEVISRLAIERGEFWNG